MKRVIFLLVIVVSILLLCSCGEISNNSIIKYLKTKYNQDFTYVRVGDDVWSSKTRTRIFSDESGNEFGVRFFKEHSDSISDNYQSYLYDDEIAAIFQNSFPKTYKIFASTKTYYTTFKFNDLESYLADAANAGIWVYTANDDYNLEEVEETLKNIVINNNMNNNWMFGFYQISNEDFNNIVDVSSGLKYYNTHVFRFNNEDKNY